MLCVGYLMEQKQQDTIIYVALEFILMIMDGLN
jgi:hypothetical protein